MIFCIRARQIALRNVDSDGAVLNDGNRNFAGMNVPLNEGKPPTSEENGAARLSNQYLGLQMKFHQLQGWPDPSLIMPPMPNSRAQPHRPIPDLRNIRSNMTSNEIASNNRYIYI